MWNSSGSVRRTENTAAARPDRSHQRAPVARNSPSYPSQSGVTGPGGFAKHLEDDCMPKQDTAADKAAAAAAAGEEAARAEAVQRILARHTAAQDRLLPILIDVQEEVGYLPADGIAAIADFLGSDAGQIYSVASFYSQFRLTPVGRHHIRLCRGTACHVRGAPRILDELETATGLAEGETSADLEYTLETVACIGCCALAPAVKVNDDVHGEVTPDRAREIVADLNGKGPNGG